MSSIVCHNLFNKKMFFYSCEFNLVTWVIILSEVKTKKRIRYSFKNLEEEVINKGICTLCGACEGACPTNAISISAEKPTLVGRCTECGICYNVCPARPIDYDEMNKIIFGDNTNVDPMMGYYLDIKSLRTSDEEIARRGQDGGVVSTILIYALEKGYIDGALVAGLRENMLWFPEPMIARTPEEVLKAAGTKYTPSPNLKLLRKAVKMEKLSKIAVVGTPCIIKGIRRVETKPVNWAKKAVALRIGLFCMESFWYDDLMKKLSSVVPVENIAKMNIKGKFIVQDFEGREYYFKLSELSEGIRGSCIVCEDFASELADISVGGIGSKNGYSTVVMRTKKGLDLINEMIDAGYLVESPIADEILFYNMLINISENKKFKTH